MIITFKHQFAHLHFDFIFMYYLWCHSNQNTGKIVGE